MDAKDRNVFINCPFDADYRQLLIATLFTVKSLGFQPRMALENSDVGQPRLATIVDLIRQSRFGIHDISRMVAGATGELARMNMPFELGLDYGCKHFGGAKAASNKILVLDAERYRFQRALSDLAGSDIANHDDDPLKLIRKVRNWFVTSAGIKRARGASTLWYDFNDFNEFLGNTLIDQGHDPDDIDDLPIPEICGYMDEWFDASRTR